MSENKEQAYNYNQLIKIGLAMLLVGAFIWYGMFPPFEFVWIGLEIAFILSFLRQLHFAVSFS